MNFGIIGYGTIGRTHAQVIEGLAGAKLAAIATRTPENARMAGEKHACAFYTDYREMLKRDDIDIVTICTPAALHLPMALDAAAAGKHCILEKPIEINTERSQRIIEAFDRRGLTLSVIFQHRFDPASRLLKDAIGRGAFGQLHYGAAKTIWFRDEDYYRATVWRGAWDGDGGGALMNQAIHSIDLLQYLMGPVEAVCGKYDTLYHREIEAEDLGVALLRFKSGAIGVIEGMTLAWPGLYSGVGVFGQLGSAGIRNDALEHYSFRAGKDPRFEALLEQGKKDPSRHLSFVRQYEDVIDAVEHGRPPLVTGQEGLKPVQLVMGIYESSRKNEWVSIG